MKSGNNMIEVILETIQRPMKRVAVT